MIKLFKESQQVRLWIKYAVIPSFIPIILIVIYDIILGCTIANIVNKHLVDFLLVVFAITVSVYGAVKELNRKARPEKVSSEIDGEKIDGEKIDNYALCSIAVGVWCTAFFTFLYDKLKPEDNLSFKKIIFCLVQIMITRYIIYIGMQTENALGELSQPVSSKTITNSQSQEVDQPNV